MDTITEHIQKLPRDIQNIILKYSYKSQNKLLLDDIKSFHKTNITLTKMYEEIYNDYSSETYKDWLSNDIDGFMNTDQATMYGYTEDYYKMWKRMFHLTRKNNQFIYNKTMFMNTNSIGAFRTRLGLLIPKERIALTQYLEDLQFNE